MNIPANGRLKSYLDDLDRIQATLDRTHRQISSGTRVGVPSDDPAAVPAILDTQASIEIDEQVTANLKQVSAELLAGDSALQQAARLLDQAITLGAQGANSITDPSQYETLAAQARGIQESLVGIAATAVNGRYIFSGDRDGQPLYAIDPDSPNGVTSLGPATSTIRILDRQGVELWRARTAADIFDHGDAAGGNVFAAVAGLLAALSSGDAAASQTAVAQLQTAGGHLNQQLGLYGMAETRVADAISASSRALVSENQALGSLRDTDVAGAAITLSQTGLQQQAALSIGARLAQRSLFDFMA